MIMTAIALYYQTCTWNYNECAIFMEYTVMSTDDVLFTIVMSTDDVLFTNTKFPRSQIDMHL